MVKGRVVCTDSEMQMYLRDVCFYYKGESTDENRLFLER